jgi:hypothetical protein
MKKHTIEEIAKARKEQIDKGVKPVLVDITGDIPNELCDHMITACPICLKETIISKAAKTYIQ